MIRREPAEPLQPAPPGVVYTADDDVMGPRQKRAVAYLSKLGRVGEDALRRLHAEGAVQEPRARDLLERLAKRGFHKPEAN